MSISKAIASDISTTEANITMENLPMRTATNSTMVGALSRQQAANYLSISTRLLDDLLTAGDIPRIKIGRKTVVRVVDLDKYLDRLVGASPQ